MKTRTASTQESVDQYWQTKLANAASMSSPCRISFDLTPQEIHGKPHPIDDFVLDISEVLVTQLHQLARSSNATLSTVLLSAFKVLISRYLDIGDITIGASLENDQHQDQKHFLPLRTQLYTDEENAEQISFEQILSRVRETVHGTSENQLITLDRILNLVKLTRTSTMNPLFQIMFIFNDDSDTATSQTASLDKHRSDCEMIIHIFRSTASTLLFRFSYFSDCYNKDTIASISEQYHYLLQSIVQPGALSQPFKSLKVMSDAEKRRIIFDFNNTDKDYGAPQCLHALFEQQVARTPDAIALDYDGIEVTYAELNRRSNRLAHHLRHNLGLKTENIVALCFHNGINMIVAILAVLKSGAAYLLLNVDNPKDRQILILEDANVNVVLTQTDLMNSIPQELKITIVNLDDKKWHLDSLENESNMNLSDVRPNHLCYVLYTSGSTGKPKGCMIEHRNVVNYVNWKHDFINSTGRLRRYLFGNDYIFDASTLNIYCSLLKGFTLCITDKKNLLTDIADAIRRLDANVMFATPTTLSLIDDPSSIPMMKVILVGGEKMRPKVRFIWEKHVELIDSYGPTETTVIMTCKKLSYWNQDEKLECSKEAPRIGRPYENNKAYIMHEISDQPGEFLECPIGVPGELFIGGAQVGRGYLNRPDLTEKAFIPNPFRPGERMYRTGDLVRWRANGEIEYMGRIGGDSQVKIRGIRTELSEIEQNMLALSWTSSSNNERKLVAVCVHLWKSSSLQEQNMPEQTLVAYVVLPEVDMDERQSIKEIKKLCRERLMPHMIPNLIIPLNKIPVNSSRKTDCKSLPQPTQAMLIEYNNINDRVYVAPSNNLERILVEAFAKTLSLPPENISTTDDFFILGGNSLLSARLLNNLRSSEVGISTTIGTIMQMRTPAALAAHLVSSGLVSTEGTVKSKTTDLFTKPIALTNHEGDHLHQTSAGQKRMWFSFVSHPDSTEYNLLFRNMFEIKRNINSIDIHKIAAAMATSLNRYVIAHDILRSTYSYQNDELIQLVHEFDSKTHGTRLLDYRSSSSSSDQDSNNSVNEFQNIISERNQRGFDLIKGPICEFIVAIISEQCIGIMMAMHHIASDGESMKLINTYVSDALSAAISGSEINIQSYSPTVQYGDYAAWESSLMKSDTWKNAEKYWQDKLNDAASLNTPCRISFDRIPNDMSTTHPAKNVHFEISDALSHQLKQFADNHKVTM